MNSSQKKIDGKRTEIAIKCNNNEGTYLPCTFLLSLLHFIAIIAFFIVINAFFNYWISFTYKYIP